MAIARVWQISDLIKKIGSLKHEFENAYDKEKLANTKEYQRLLLHTFYFKNNNGISIKKNGKRLYIYINKSEPYIIVRFQTYEKRKRIPYYFNIIFLSTNDSPLINQNKMYEMVLGEPILLKFFF